MVNINKKYIKIFIKSPEYRRYRIIVFFSIVLILSFFTYFWNYQNPNGLFWDENYHIASSEKYLQGVFFMEPHPPLGKEIIALGELIINPNQGLDKSTFVSTDYIHSVPNGYSFAGVRFFPALLAFLSAAILFFIFILIIKRVYISFALTFLYIFDNAIIVHSRGAMLEGIQLFFILSSILIFLYLWQKIRIKPVAYLILGTIISAAIATKVNASIIIPLGGFLLIKEYSKPFTDLINYNKSKPLFQSEVYTKFIIYLLEIFAKILIYLLGLASIFFISYYIHFAIAKKIVNSNYATASDTYKKVLDNGQGGLLINFPLSLSEHLYFSRHYTEGVPALDVCKVGENGSSPLDWLVGGKTINYRWSSDGTYTSYLYLVSNIGGWLIVLSAIILSIILVLGHYIYGIKIKNRDTFNLIQIFLLLYVGYIGSVLTVTRVLYMYHYFIPLIFGMILVGLLFIYNFEEDLLRGVKDSFRIYLIATIIAFIVLEVFFYFSPFSYYVPINKEQFQSRNFFGIWKMQSQ